MQGNGSREKTKYVMAPAHKYGLMEQDTKAAGSLIKLTAKESSGIRTAISTTATGKMIKRTAMAFTRMLMVRDTKASGVMTSSMGLV